MRLGQHVLPLPFSHESRLWPPAAAISRPDWRVLPLTSRIGLDVARGRPGGYRAGFPGHAASPQKKSTASPCWSGPYTGIPRTTAASRAMSAGTRRPLPPDSRPSATAGCPHGFDLARKRQFPFQDEAPRHRRQDAGAGRRPRARGSRRRCLLAHVWPGQIDGDARGVSLYPLFLMAESTRSRSRAPRPRQPDQGEEGGPAAPGPPPVRPGRRRCPEGGVATRTGKALFTTADAVEAQLGIPRTSR
jgi:hypothetical protein